MARLNRVASFRGTTKTEDGCLTCGKCREKICKGDSYVWWANRLPGSRSGTKNVRCAKPECRPKQSEMTPGRRGELLSIQEDTEESLRQEGLTADDLETIAQEAAGRVREIAEGLTESADNIEDGFGHETQQSEELRSRADEIESAADEIENVDLDDPPEEGDEDFIVMVTCPECDGTGEQVEGRFPGEGHEVHDCGKCDGTGEVKDELASAEAFQEALSEWHEAQVEKVIEAVNEVDLG